MNIRSTHRTIYRYATPSTDSQNEVRLQPLNDRGQTCIQFRLSTIPETKIFNHTETGGTVHHFTIRGPHTELQIVAEAEVETFRGNAFERLDLLRDDWSYYGGDMTHRMYEEFLAPSPYVSRNPHAAELALEARRLADGPSVAGFLLSLNQLLFKRFTYDPDVTHVHTTVDEVIALQSGVCQDFAHVMIACCRSLGVPARYVSGYLYSRRLDSLRGYAAMHAWTECLLPDGEWLALDPTNNLLENDNYVRVHLGRDYSEVAPTRGVYIGAPAQGLEVNLHVEELGHSVGV